MSCSRCLRRAARHNAIVTPARNTACQFFHSYIRRAEPVTAQVTSATNPRPNERPAVDAGERQHSKPPTKVQSSAPAGTALKGLNFMKGKQDPVAMEEHEYPEWLWGVLAQGEGKAGGQENEGDLFCMRVLSIFPGTIPNIY